MLIEKEFTIIWSKNKIKDPISKLYLDTNLFMNMYYKSQVNYQQSIMHHIKKITGDVEKLKP